MIKPTPIPECKKVCYSTEHFALMDIHKIKRTSTRPLVPQRAYFCHVHESWHLTSSTCETELYIKRFHKRMELVCKELKDLKQEFNMYKSQNGNKLKKLEELQGWYNEFLQITQTT